MWRGVVVAWCVKQVEMLLGFTDSVHTRTPHHFGQREKAAEEQRKREEAEAEAEVEDMPISGKLVGGCAHRLPLLNVEPLREHRRLT